MKRNLSGIGCACALALLSACATTEGSGDASSYTAVDYALYPTPDDAFVADVMPIENEGKLELYYLYETDHNIQAYHPIHKFSTENFYQYEDLGLAVPCGTAKEPDVAIGTGSVFKAQDGLFHCFYTGHNDSFAAQGKPKECVLHAVSKDGISWEKKFGEVLYAPEGYSNSDFRDPQVFWNEDDKCYWMLVATREEANGGIVAKFTSTDLTNWTFKGPLYAPHKQYMLECPDLFKMGDKYYLFFSWDCVTYYAVGKTMNGPFTAPKDNVLDGTNFIFYAAKTAELKGKRYLCGWLGRSEDKGYDTGKYRWAGNMLIHQLVQHEDGSLGVKMPETIAEHFPESKEISAGASDGTVEKNGASFKLRAKKGEKAAVDLGERAATMLLECDVTIGKDGIAGFAFGNPQKNFKNWYALALDAKRNCIHYEGYKIGGFESIVSSDPLAQTRFSFKPGEKHHVTVVAENEIFIVYIDDAKVLSSRIYNSVNGAHMALYTTEADATFENISIKTTR
ncbi:family 43 glycosylhydrolase [Treponema saccharophilum]|uniref:family 43 glycosylhydrolase n=1 Tax=Treponema saccharophilum TaxID=165 RepID=UPI003866682E